MSQRETKSEKPGSRQGLIWALVLAQVISPLYPVAAFASTRSSERSGGASVNNSQDEVRFYDTSDCDDDTLTTPWTKWDRCGMISGLKVLSHIREQLNLNNLHDSHLGYFGYKAVDCSKLDTSVRSADGACTDLARPLAGAAYTAFGRNVPPEYIDKDAEKKLMTPDPGLVSREMFTREEFKEVPFLNMLAASWIQFMNHDWLSHGKNSSENALKMFDSNGNAVIVERTQSAGVNSAQHKKEFQRVSLNTVTHWWDGSQVYGSSLAEQSELRRGAAPGKLRLEMGAGGRTLLPKPAAGTFDAANNRQNHGLELTGFRDNWWLGLSLLHTLFAKEHNAIVDELMVKHVEVETQSSTGSPTFAWINEGERTTLTPQQLNEKLFQTARLINSAVMAKIHTVEWTPAVLPNPVLQVAMKINWYGLLNPATWANNRSNPNSFSNRFGLPEWLNVTRWFNVIRLGHVTGGIVGGELNDYGVPFSITEEFTSVYRLHSLLPENIVLRKVGGVSKEPVAQIPFADTRNEKSRAIMEKNSLSDMFYSFGVQRPGQLVLNNFPRFMQRLEVPGLGSHMDLALVDIVRDRERGVPRYNQFRRAIGLRPIESYRDFFPAGSVLDARQLKVIEKFNRVYGKDSEGNDNVELIDLLVGTSAEEVRPASFGFGETMFQIFVLMASRRLMADRFFTTDYNAETYSTAGMHWIDREGSLSRVIARHMPELERLLPPAAYSAFYPWKKGDASAPESP